MDKNEIELVGVADNEADSNSKARQNHGNWALRGVGKKPVLKPKFGFFAILGFSCVLLGTWEGVILTFTIPLANGGPAGAIYSYIYVWIGTFAAFTSLSELASMYVATIPDDLQLFVALLFDLGVMELEGHLLPAGNITGFPCWHPDRGKSLPALFSAGSLPWALSCIAADFEQVHPRQKHPQLATALVAGIATLLSLIIFGSGAVLNDVISLTVSAVYGSYFVPASFLLYRRLTGAIQPCSHAPTGSIMNTVGAPLYWGPFHIRVMLGTAINAFAVIYLGIGFIFTFFPNMVNPTLYYMNWAIAGTGSVTLISVVYYFAWGRREFAGPVVEFDRD